MWTTLPRFAQPFVTLLHAVTVPHYIAFTICFVVPCCHALSTSKSEGAGIIAISTDGRGDQTRWVWTARASLLVPSSSLLPPLHTVYICLIWLGIRWVWIIAGPNAEFVLIVCAKYLCASNGCYSCGPCSFIRFSELSVLDDFFIAHHMFWFIVVTTILIALHNDCNCIVIV